MSDEKDLDFEVSYVTNDFNSGFSEKRDCYDFVRNYILDKHPGQSRICAIFGIRRTGKTVLMKQVMEYLPEEEKKKTIFITCNNGTDFHNIVSFMNDANKEGYTNFFIDEITYAEGFQQIGEILPDVFVNNRNSRVVLTGTDSLALSLISKSNLYDRILFVPTTFTIFPEYARIMKCSSLDDYIKKGTTFRSDTYNSKSNADDYIETAITENLINSLTKSESISNFQPELTELYNNNEIKTAIEKILNTYNTRFVLKSLTAKFKSSIIQRGIDKLLEKELRENSTNTPLITKSVDSDKINENLKRFLNIVEPSKIKTVLKPAHLDKLAKFLTDMDILKIIPVFSSFANNTEESSMKIIAHPGMYHANMQYTFRELKKNDNWEPGASDEQKEGLLKKAYEFAMGDLMENFIIANVNEIMNKSRIIPKLDLDGDPNNRWYVSKLKVEVNGEDHESDLIIVDRKEKEVHLFEIKHSSESDPEQTKHLGSPDFIDYVNKHFGNVKNRIVLYNGENDFTTEIPRISASRFLISLYNQRKSNEFNINKIFAGYKEEILRGNMLKESASDKNPFSCLKKVYHNLGPNFQKHCCELYKYIGLKFKTDFERFLSDCCGIKKQPSIKAETKKKGRKSKSDDDTQGI